MQTAKGAVDLIGAGKVGCALQARAEAAGRAGRLLARADDPQVLATSPGRPLVVCTGNDDLDGVLAGVPASRRDDLVFVQNGMLRPWLAAHGLSGATRGILFFAVSRVGDDLVPGPSPSPWHGPLAETVVTWLSALDVPAEVVDAETFAGVELEKLIWNSAFGLLCDAHQASVGEVCDAHGADLRSLVAELRAVGQPALGVELALDPLVERLCAYSRSIAAYRGAVKAWPWRNGWFVVEAARQGVPTPTHRRLLAAVGKA